MTSSRALLPLALLLAVGSASCADENAADRIGVAWSCTTNADCPEVECDVEPCPVLQCLTQFSGGYCGLADCISDAECVEGSACVRHDDGRNYCFRLCTDKPQCNRHREPSVEANCSSSVEFVEPQSARACVPPSSGI